MKEWIKKLDIPAELRNEIGLDHGLFAPFPPGQSECAYCPPQRSDIFLKRAIWRAILLGARIGWIPTSKLLILVLAPIAIVYGFVAELLITIVSWIGDNMNALLSLLVVLALIIVPSYSIITGGAATKDYTSLLWDILLFGASVWFGIAVNNKNARKEATAQWVPAAESACKQLLTISATAERMRRTQATVCKSIEPVFPKDNPEALVPLKHLIEIQCRETAEKLATLRSHIDNAVSHWEVFITKNCDGGDCRMISARLEQCRTHLAQELETDSCPQSCKKDE